MSGDQIAGIVSLVVLVVGIPLWLRYLNKVAKERNTDA